MKYAVVTFGCRVNQADSLGFEEELRAARRRGRAARRGRSRRRQHLLGDGDGRSGRAPDDPTHRPRQSRRPHRRDRLLRDAAARRGRARCPNVVRVVPNDDKPRARCRSSRPTSDLTTAERFGDGDGQLRRGDRAGRRGPDGVHAARADRLRGAVLLLHHPGDARARRAACRSSDVLGEVDARGGGRLQGDCADRRASRLVRPRPDAAARR